MVAEILKGGFRDLESGGGLHHGGDTADLVWVALGLTLHVGVDVVAGLLDITCDIKGVTWGLGDGETVVEGDAAGNGTESDDYTPHLVDGQLADTSAVGGFASSDEGLLETGSHNQSNDCGCELTNTLHGEHSVHHGSSPLGGGKLGSNDGRQWVITTDSDTLID